MSKPIFYGRIDFIELLTAVSFLQSDKDRSDWLMSFSRALATNEHGKNGLADSILNEAKISRDAESKRKEAYRAKFVPRTDTDGRGLTRERQTVSVPVSVSEEVNTKKNKTPLPPTGEFDEFWNLYPKKIDKQGANKALLRALKKTTIRIITEAVLVARESPQWQRNEGQYIPNPTTWLNQERWSAVVEVEDKQSWSYLNRELLKGAQSGQDHLAIGRDF